jgi:hypothetical protein
VEATAREALGEMRRLFGVLRVEGEQPALEPQPGLPSSGSSSIGPGLEAWTRG